MVLIIVGASVLVAIYFGSHHWVQKKEISTLKKSNILLNVRILDPQGGDSVKTSLVFFREYEKLSENVLHAFTYELSLFLEKRYQYLLVEGNFYNIFDAIEKDKNIYAETVYMFDVFTNVLKVQKLAETLSLKIDLVAENIIRDEDQDLARDFANQLKDHRGSIWLGFNKSKQQTIIKLLSCKKR
ncbi:MAG: hypothetical protein WCQ32_03370 [bacterium]